MAGQILKVKSESLKACMTCPLCNRLLQEATTISLCLHTFCRKCIYEKLSDEEGDCCPVCNVDLGCLPVEKLRADHNLQDMRAKIFPYKRVKIEAPEVMPSIALPAKRKERSLSSLVVSSPKVQIQTGFTGKRSKVNGRKCMTALRGCSSAADEPPMSTSSPGSPEKALESRRQDCSVAEKCLEQGDEDIAKDAKLPDAKSELWTPLNCLVEAANRAKSTKSSSHCPLLLSGLDQPHLANSDPHFPQARFAGEPCNGHDLKIHIPKAKHKDRQQHQQHRRTCEEKKESSSLLATSLKRKKLMAGQRRTHTTSDDPGLLAQAIVDSEIAKVNRRNVPIWFSLVASDEQNEGTPLPQISTCYLRIKDGKMPVSYIQKYLVQKLDLACETEVEILCRGQPVLPTSELCSLVDLWFRTASTSKKVPASIGSSAKDFVMVLSYCRKNQPLIIS